MFVQEEDLYRYLREATTEWEHMLEMYDSSIFIETLITEVHNKIKRNGKVINIVRDPDEE
jgi:hypothetical protein